MARGDREDEVARGGAGTVEVAGTGRRAPTGCRGLEGIAGGGEAAGP